ncbi:MAG: Ribosomal large subunit pseudouridine synthase B [bacterium ADurb.Bin374]|nr:MAG: Ribosomal large subunit pseudouridine synthase B [bacterium ADurb.Bin374]
MEPIRLTKLLASWGIASRRAVEEWIEAGRIRLNGQVVDQQGVKADPDVDTIEVDGRRVTAPSTGRRCYLALYKPLGYVSTMSDEHGRKALPDLLPKGLPRLFPIGRLDLDSTGLLLMTDDGELANRLLHPRYKVEKGYRVEIRGTPLSADEQRRFTSGLELDDGLTAPCRLQASKQPGVYLVALREGRKRQIRRMFAVLGRDVTALHRISFGPITLGTLGPGATRLLTDAETKALRQAAGLEE